MTLFDTHAHYDDEAFDADRDAVLAAFDGLVIDPGCTLASSQAAVDLAARHPHVYAAVGIHPENCGDFVPEHMDALRQLAREPKVVAIGEIGLDYYWPENPPHDFQQQVFRAQLELDDEGYFRSGEDCRTRLPGVFVAGDCRAKEVRQLATAVGDGAVAGLAAARFVEDGQG